MHLVDQLVVHLLRQGAADDLQWRQQGRWRGVVGHEDRSADEPHDRGCSVLVEDRREDPHDVRHVHTSIISSGCDKAGLARSREPSARVVRLAISAAALAQTHSFLELEAVPVLRPTPSTVKSLFALSGNTCSYRGCESVLADPNWLEVNCDIAHICGERAGAARYDPDMSDEDRRAFDNLILLCPGCHRKVDRLDPSGHPAHVLRQMKEDHEGRSMEAGQWATEDGLVWAASQALSQFAAANPVPGESRPTQVPDNFGQLVREARERQGLSLYALGKRAGISGSTIKDIEREVDLPAGRHRSVLTATYNKLVEALGLERDLS